MGEPVWHAVTTVLVVAVIVEGVVLAAALRHLGTILLQVGPPRHGDVQEGPELGREVHVDSLVSGHPAMILFLGPTCSLCKPVASALPTIRDRYEGLQLVPIVVGEDVPLKKTYAAALRVQGGRTDLDPLFREWGVPGTPFVVGVGRNGRVRARGVANNLAQLETMAEFLTGREPEPVTPDPSLVSVAEDSIIRGFTGDASG